MSYELTGKLHKKYETESKSEKFQAREFVVETMDGSYNQYIKFQLTQDRCDAVENFQEGQQIKVHFDLRGREWNEKYFTNLNAWRLEAVSSAPPQTADPKTVDYINGNADEIEAPEMPKAKAPSPVDNDLLPF